MLIQEGGGNSFVEHLTGHVRRVAIEQRIAAGVLLEEAQHLGHERRVLAALRFERCPLGGLRQVRYVMKQGLDPFPARGIHRGSQLARRSSRASHALAARQSRSTVASDTPSSSALSATSNPPKNRLSTTSA